MNKFKFGDKVTHNEFGLGLVLGCYLNTSKNVYFYNVAWSVLGGGCSLSHFVESSLTPVSDWIPCSERMPEPNINVLLSNGEEVDMHYWSGEEDDIDDYVLSLYWMPLPTPPK